MTDNTTTNTITTINGVRVDPQPGPVGLTKESAKADKKAAKSKTAKKAEATAKPSGGAKVRKRITAPARLEKLQQQWRAGELPSGIVISNSGGNFKAFEYVSEK